MNQNVSVQALLDVMAGQRNRALDDLARSEAARATAVAEIERLTVELATLKKAAEPKPKARVK